MTPGFFRFVVGVGQWLDARKMRGLLREPTLGNPEWTALRAALEGGDWKPAASALARRTTWAERHQVVRVASEWPEKPRWLAAWLAAEPDSAAAHLVAGATWTWLAWVARGNGLSETISDEDGRRFFECLGRADEHLVKSARLDAADPTPWAFAIRAGRGNNVDGEEAALRFEGARSRDPRHLVAHFEMLQYRCAKWFGSHDAMWAFVNESLEGVKDGPLHALVPVAHHEHANAPGGDIRADAGDYTERYWKQPVVRDQVVTAFHRIREGADADSADGLLALSHAACGLWRCGARDEARAAFSLVGDRLTALPWGWSIRPATMFRRARRQSGAR